MKQRKTTLLLILLIAALAITAGSASAEKSITIDVPETAAIGQVTTVPVTIHDADKIAGFVIHVPNTIAGTVITINSAEPLTGGSYTVSSAPEQTEQAIVWFTAGTGITGTQTLFSIDILPSASSPASIPLTIEVIGRMYNYDMEDVHLQYPVRGATLTVPGAAGTPDPTPAATQTPSEPAPTGEQPPIQTPTPSESAPTTSGESEAPILSPEQPANTPAAESPGFSVALIAAVLGAAVLIETRRKV